MFPRILATITNSFACLRRLAIDALRTAAVLFVAISSRSQVLSPRLPDSAAHRLIVVYREGAVSRAIPSAISGAIPSAIPGAIPGARVLASLPDWGIAVVEPEMAGPNEQGLRQLEGQLQSRLQSDPAVAYVVHDVAIRGSELRTAPVDIARVPPVADWYYTSSPQAWAVQQVGGYGRNVASRSTPAGGPWDLSMGAGVRIAILDSGVSSAHPDIAPNLIYQQSLIDQTALPSPCDDGSVEDQQGHGTFTASLAAGALGPGTGMVVGVAPQASLLNIKVMQRMPASGSGSQQSLCEQGSTGGLMSWLIEGIAAASAQHADIISISAGSLLDTDSGDAEGLIAAVNRAVYNATQAGALVIAAAGNDGEALDNSQYIEMPAQAEDALAVVASTNPQCGQNLTPGAKCQPAAVAIPYYSNYGTTLQSVAAPGGSLPQDTSGIGVSGFVRGACATGLPRTANGLPSKLGRSLGCFNLGHIAYVEAIGTSASAPLVAGVAAILKGAYPSLTPAQIASALRSSATPTAEASVGAPVNTVNAATALAALAP